MLELKSSIGVLRSLLAICWTLVDEIGELLGSSADRNRGIASKADQNVVELVQYAVGPEEGGAGGTCGWSLCLQQVP